tara:strand:+ start:10914 stop:11933 length:1020 start_codon:yes stop_codon:yes gene_type:complete
MNSILLSNYRKEIGKVILLFLLVYTYIHINVALIPKELLSDFYTNIKFINTAHYYSNYKITYDISSGYYSILILISKIINPKELYIMLSSTAFTITLYPFCQRDNGNIKWYTRLILILCCPLILIFYLSITRYALAQSIAIAIITNIKKYKYLKEKIIIFLLGIFSVFIHLGVLIIYMFILFPTKEFKKKLRGIIDITRGKRLNFKLKNTIYYISASSIILILINYFMRFNNSIFKRSIDRYLVYFDVNDNIGGNSIMIISFIVFLILLSNWNNNIEIENKKLLSFLILVSIIYIFVPIVWRYMVTLLIISVGYLPKISNWVVSLIISYSVYLAILYYI